MSWGQALQAEDVPPTIEVEFPGSASKGRTIEIGILVTNNDVAPLDFQATLTNVDTGAEVATGEISDVPQSTTETITMETVMPGKDLNLGVAVLYFSDTEAIGPCELAFTVRLRKVDLVGPLLLVGPAVVAGAWAAVKRRKRK